MEAAFCEYCLEDVLRKHGKPEIFNSDQRSQFTSSAFTGVLNQQGIAISMDGRERTLDKIFVERLWRNVKYEDMYPKGYATMGELTIRLAQYFTLYNGERPHQAFAVARSPTKAAPGIALHRRSGDAAQSAKPARSSAANWRRSSRVGPRIRQNPTATATH